MAGDQYTPQDPVGQHPRPEFPEQDQPHPGSGRRMSPEPDHGEPDGAPGDGKGSGHRWWVLPSSCRDEHETDEGDAEPDDLMAGHMLFQHGPRPHHRERGCERGDRRHHDRQAFAHGDEQERGRGHVERTGAEREPARVADGLKSVWSMYLAIS